MFLKDATEMLKEKNAETCYENSSHSSSYEQTVTHTPNAKTGSK